MWLSVCSPICRDRGVRLGAFRDGGAELVTGADFVISTQPVLGSAERASTTYSLLAREVGVGDEILANDGMVRLQVLSSNGSEIQCRVVQGGFVGDHKGLNLPGVAISAPALTPKDVDDLRFALDAGVDLVALSFVRRPSDVQLVRAVMDDVGRRVPVLAKLEKPEAVAALDDVVAAFDGLMVARGDLGVELPLQQVPLVQKRAIQAAREQAKPVIVATQMLESMITAPRPTRAEVSDVANAVLDGADALMLSGETFRRSLTHGSGQDHGAGHRRYRAEPRRRHPATQAPADGSRSGDHAGRRGDRVDNTRVRTCRVHADRNNRAPALCTATSIAAPGLHSRPRSAEPTHAVVGCRVIRRADGRDDRRDDQRGQPRDPDPRSSPARRHRRGRGRHTTG